MLSLLRKLYSSAETWRVGDWVEVRSLDEIMTTLDNRASLEAMPFMPEMVPCCGKRFQIVKSAHKTCDSSGWEYLRSLNKAVHLDTRCEGSSHGGCQAGCRFFWKTAWLRKVDGPLPDEQSQQNGKSMLPSVAEALQNATQVTDTEGNICYRCQATEIKYATTLLKPRHISQYIRDVSSGNVTLPSFAYYVGLAVLKTIKVVGRNILIQVTERSMIKKKSIKSTPLNLKAGDKVRIKSRYEILATLNDERKNFGLSFDPDMAAYCNTTHTVIRKIERIIDEKTGKIMHLSHSSYALQDVLCTGCDCRTRLFCSRGSLTFWRDGWLDPVDGENPSVVPSPSKKGDRPC